MKTISIRPAIIVATGIAGIIFSLTVSSSVQAQENGYWAGKTLTINIAYPPGGGYDSHARLLGRHIDKHLPGNPNVRAVNRPGAGGNVAANHLYEQAPKDGTHILVATREIALAQRLNVEGVRYDIREMPVLGSPTSDNRVWVGAPNSNITNLAELKNYDGEYLYGVSGRGAGSAQMVELLEAAGYPVSIITGYQGTGEQMLGLLRGEIQGINSTYPGIRDVINDEGLVIVAKLGNHPDLDQYDDVRDHLEGDLRSLASILSAPLAAGRPFITTPGIPDDVLAMLRQAFADTMNDPAYIRELEQMGDELAFSSPEVIEELFLATLDASDAVIAPFQE